MVGKDGPGGSSRPVSNVFTTKNALRPGEQRLLELAHRVGYGSLRKLKIRDGELVCGPYVRTKQRFRLGRTESGRGTRPTGEDFLLKSQHVECIERIRKIRNGVVTIVVQDGLPIDLVVEEDMKA